MAVTVCLNMIVKNEALVVERCLASVRPLIDRWVVVDTGSTDGTQQVVREALKDLPGELHERPWVDFAANRTEALELAGTSDDYLLIIDADDALEYEPNFIKPELTLDCYELEIRDGPIAYTRPQIVRSALPWRWRGVLHEFLACDGARSGGLVAGVSLRRNHDGARRRASDTYQRDARILEGALATETDPFLHARYTFYLAQSYQDCGETVLALRHYLARAELGFWQDERFVSLYRAAQIKEQLGYPDQEVIDSYLTAAAAAPARAEALHAASRFCRLKRRFAEGYCIAKRGLALNIQESALFAQPWIYETGLLDEFAVNAYWTGRYRESLDACLLILSSELLKGAERRRVSANARFALHKLSEEHDESFGEPVALRTASPRQVIDLMPAS